MLGVERSNVKESIIHKMNHIHLIAKTCNVLFYKKTNTNICLAIMFEQQIQIRKVELMLQMHL